MRSGLFVSVTDVSSFWHSQNYYWSSCADFTGLANDGVAFVIHETIYYGTGNHVDFAESHRFFAFDLSSLQWEEVALFPMNGGQYCSVFVLEKMLIFLVGHLPFFIY